jgi:deoxyribose-phosphate aldolase
MAVERATSFTKRSIKGASKRDALRMALSMLDLTTLEGKDSAEKARALCAKARQPLEGAERLLGEALPPCAAVCVYPALVTTCVESLKGTSVKVASVATGFPSGQYPLEVREEDTRRAVAAGADEIDMVISRGLFLAGRYDDVIEEIVRIKRACVRPDGTCAHLKVILETGELETLDLVRRASDLAMQAMHDSGAKPHDHGADFIKTSTGKVQPAATMPVTLVMLEAIRAWYFKTGQLIGMKPAGGIRTAKQAVQYLVMVRETMGGLDVAGFDHVRGNPWLTPDYFRFGASTLCNDILRQIVRGRSGRYASHYDFSES